MTAVYITIDTEYSAALAHALGPDSHAENFARSIACETPAGAVGIHYQMEVMERHGLMGVFFVDPMPALLWGTGAIADIVKPIVARGHEVQLHLHTEWLELAGSSNPLGSRTGQNLRDFSLDEQEQLIALARDLLMEAGAPRPNAFRAGNYGADDNTLRALTRLGIAYDTSHAPGIAASACRISLGQHDRKVVSHCGALEVPVGTLPGLRAPRHAQITALSGWEMQAALRYAVASGIPMLNIVSHSFELLSRNRSRINPIVRGRFARLCKAIAQTKGAETAGFASRPPAPGEETGCPSMPRSEVRLTARTAEQLCSNLLYGRN